MLTNRYLNFVMAGGNGTAPVGLQVLDINNQVLATFTPNNCGPSFINLRDDWHHIDLQAHLNTMVKVRIFDNEPGGCGFLSFDHVYISDTAQGTP
jgi:hypothetical protein